MAPGVIGRDFMGEKLALPIRRRQLPCPQPCRQRSGLDGGCRSAARRAPRVPCKPMHAFALCLAVVLATIYSHDSAVAQTNPLPKPMKPYKVQGDFVGKKGKKPAKDLSGIACLPPGEGNRRTCLVVNDENPTAQFAVIEEDRLIVGSEITLIGTAPDAKTLGSKPTAPCPNGKGEFAEFDGEGVAYSASYFYVVGSHGCARNKGEFRLSSFILARIRVDGQGRPVGSDGKPLPAGNTSAAVETTYRVSDLLQRAGDAAKFFGKDLKTANGLNIEGVSVDGDRLWLGLRAPVVGGKAFLVGANIPELFHTDSTPAKSAPEVIPIELNPNLGIRDLTPLPDKRLLVLAGAPEGPAVAYRLFAVDPGNRTVKPLKQLPSVERVEGKKKEKKLGKAEAITVLDATADQVRVLILFDDLENGAPHEDIVSLK
jgi:hypothetical protein